MAMMANALNFVSVDFVPSSLFLLLLSSPASIAAHCRPPSAYPAAWWTVPHMPMASNFQHLHLCPRPVCSMYT